MATVGTNQLSVEQSAFPDDSGDDTTQQQEENTTLAASATVVMMTLILGLMFALIRLPYMGSDEHFKVNADSMRRPVLFSFVHSMSIQFFIGPILVTPVSGIMQYLYLVQLVLAFIIASGLFMILATRFDSLLFTSAKA